LKAIEANPRLTRQGIATELGIKKNTVEHYLSVLKADGRLERKGSDKSGEWVILK
jgi:predicted HTH transcriptional regulator